MRWTNYAPGDYREKTRFLLFPKTIGYETRWLEVATWEEKYNPCNEYNSLFSNWVPTKWIE